MDSIGQFLNDLRGKMTLREAADKSGLSHSYIRYLEIGKRPGSDTPIHPTPDTLKRLSKAYQYPYEDLMKAAGYLNETTPSNPKATFSEGQSESKAIEVPKNLAVDGKELTNDEMELIQSVIRSYRFAKEKE